MDLLIGTLEDPKPPETEVILSEVAVTLEALLHDPQANIRAEAADVLGVLEQAPFQAIESLKLLLNDPEFTVRVAAAQSLGTLGQDLPEVIKILQDSIHEQQGFSALYRTISALARLSTQSTTVLNLLSEISRSDNSAQVFAALTSLILNKQLSYENFTTALITIFEGHDEELIQERGRFLLIAIDSHMRAEWMQIFLDLLKHESSVVRKRVMKVLGRTYRFSNMEQVMPKVVNALGTLLHDPEPSVRVAAAHSLGELNFSTPKVVDTLETLLHDPEPSVRAAAAHSLGELNFSTPKVVDALETLLHDPEFSTCEAAAYALVTLKVVSSDLVALLPKLLVESKHWYIRTHVANRLGQLGSADNNTIDLLLHGLLDEDNDVRSACAQALANFGRRFPESRQLLIDVLTKALNDPMFEKTDKHEHRTGQDYAFTSLWMLVTGEQTEDDEVA